MKTPREAFVAAVLVLTPAAAQLAASPQHSSTPPGTAYPRADAGERDRALAAGRKLFNQRCARCHGERGDKPLSSGLPLSQRKLTPEHLARSVNGRLQNSTEEQRRAVQLYIKSFLNWESQGRSSN
jgi:mono/diheme cytochrome c family protein